MTVVGFHPGLLSAQFALQRNWFPDPIQVKSLHVPSNKIVGKSRNIKMMWKYISCTIKIVVAIGLQVDLHLSYPNSGNPAGTLLVPILERDGRILAERSCPRVDGKCFALSQQHQANMILDKGCFLHNSTVGILQWWATPCETWKAFCWLTVHSPPLTIWDGKLMLSIVWLYQLVIRIFSNVARGPSKSL